MADILFDSQVLAPVVGNDVIVNTILPVVTEMARDNVPNVRFNVAKTLELLMTHMTDKSAVSAKIVPILNSLDEDQDKDVKYFAHKALVAGMPLVCAFHMACPSSTDFLCCLLCTSCSRRISNGFLAYLWALVLTAFFPFPHGSIGMRHMPPSDISMAVWWGSQGDFRDCSAENARSTVHR